MTVSEKQEKPVVLIVEDDDQARRFLVTGLHKFSYVFDVIAASNGQEALDTLKMRHADLVVTDLRMPVMDGFTLLTHLVELYPHMPRIVMTSMPKELQETIQAAGIVAFLSKPVIPKDLGALICTTLKNYATTIHAENLNVASFAQLISLEEKTGTLGIQEQSTGRCGEFFFHKGDLVDALAGERRGEEAVYSVMRWKDVRLWVRDHVPDKLNRTIMASLPSILMEAVRLADEAAAEGASGDNLHPTPEDLRASAPSELRMEDDRDELAGLEGCSEKTREFLMRFRPRGSRASRAT